MELKIIRKIDGAENEMFKLVDYAANKVKVVSKFTNNVVDVRGKNDTLRNYGFEYQPYQKATREVMEQIADENNMTMVYSFANGWQAVPRYNPNNEIFSLENLLNEYGYTL